MYEIILSLGVLLLAALAYFSYSRIKRLENMEECPHEFELYRVCKKCGKHQKGDITGGLK